MDIILKSMRKNLISKKTGMGNHMIADKNTNIIFPKATKFIGIINTKGEKGWCIENQYVTIEWIKKLIKTKQWGDIGKEHALYEYFVDDGDTNKPNMENTEGDDDEVLYYRASGDMQFDFDDITDEEIDDLKNSFLICSSKNPSYHWFEYSWSHNYEHKLSGCHIRVYANLKMKTKIEWGFWYIHLLNGILKHLNENNRKNIINHIDWSCCSITRGFAIPYNKDGVIIGKTFNEDDVVGIDNEDDLDKIFQNYNCEWDDVLYNKYVKKFIKPKHRKELVKMGLIDENEGYKYIYTLEDDEWDIDENHPMVDGTLYDYNWRLSLVTTLMGVFNKDKEIVRNICSVIYKYIKPYKNHTYEEMLNNELEHKIFNRGNFDLEPNHNILKELWDNWNLKISIRPNIK